MFALYVHVHPHTVCLPYVPAGVQSVIMYRFRDPLGGPRSVPVYSQVFDSAFVAELKTGQNNTFFFVQNGELFLRDPKYAPGSEVYRVGDSLRYKVVRSS